MTAKMLRSVALVALGIVSVVSYISELDLLVVVSQLVSLMVFKHVTYDRDPANCSRVVSSR